MNSSSAYEEEIKRLIIDTLKLEEVKPQDIEPTAPLFNEGLGLDSIDALELGVAIQKRYGLRFDSDPDQTRKHFASVRALASYIEQHKTAGASC